MKSNHLDEIPSDGTGQVQAWKVKDNTFVDTAFWRHSFAAINQSK